jgi:hypothetical protein
MMMIIMMMLCVWPTTSIYNNTNVLGFAPNIHAPPVRSMQRRRLTPPTTPTGAHSRWPHHGRLGGCGRSACVVRGGAFSLHEQQREQQQQQHRRRRLSISRSSSTTTTPPSSWPPPPSSSAGRTQPPRYRPHPCRPSPRHWPSCSGRARGGGGPCLPGFSTAGLALLDRQPPPPPPPPQ